MPAVLQFDGCVMAVADSDDVRAGESLTRMERSEYLALSSAPARADYRASRLAAKCVVASSQPCASGEDAHRVLGTISVLRRSGAKADVVVHSAAGHWRAVPGMLSLSHRDGRGAAVAAGSGVRAGIDVERVASIAYEHVRYFATADECERGPRDPAVLWALKEAAWKAMELGSDVPFHSLALEFTDAREVCGIRVRTLRHSARGFVFQPWGQSHVVALVLVGGGDA